MPLTDTAIRSAKPGAAPFKISDGGGLHLLVRPNGSKLWRLAYRFAGKQQGLALGAYPIVSLAKAREPYSISGNAQFHFLAASGAYINTNSQTITLTGMPAF